MKKKQYLTAILPAAVMLAVVLLNVGGQRKASALYAKAYTAAQEKDYTQAWNYLDALEAAAPAYEPQYELEAQIYLESDNRVAAYSSLNVGILRTGSKRLIQLADALQSGAQTLNFSQSLQAQTPQSTLPAVLPEDWAADSGASGTGQNTPATYQDLNYNLVVRYQDSDLGEQVQLQPAEGSTFAANGVTWSSSNPAVATVDQNGLVTCNARVGETKITAKNSINVQAECWVCVVEPDIYLEDGQQDFYYMEDQYYYVPEGNFRLGVNSNLDEAVESTDHHSTGDLLPRIQVTGSVLSGAQSFDYGSGTTAASMDFDIVDENGNPITITESSGAVSTPEQAVSSGEVEIQMGWQSMYFSGEYRIPEHLRCNGATYTPTTANFAYTQNYGITKLSVPATVVSLGMENTNPFQDYSALESFAVDEQNPTYRSEDGVLYSADGTQLLAYPTAAAAEEYTVPDGVTTIGAGAFAKNQKLTKLTIPASVTQIGSDALGQMASLSDLELEPGNTAFRMENGALMNSAGTRIVALAPGQTGESYTVSASVTDIEPSAFSNNSSIKDLTIDASCSQLTIENCSALETLTINGSVSGLSLNNCPALSRVVINAPVQTVTLYGMEQAVDLELNAEVAGLSSYSTPLNITHQDKVTSTLYIQAGDTVSSEFAPDLQYLSLDLSKSQGTVDLSVLEGNAHLNNVQITGGSVSGLSALSSLPSLTTLRLDEVKVSDWSPVWQCTRLTNLTISHCSDFQDISGISALTELTSVDFSGTGVSDISALGACQKLTFVSFNDCKQLTDVSVLDTLPNLISRNLYNSGAEQQDAGYDIITG